MVIHKDLKRFRKKEKNVEHEQQTLKKQEEDKHESVPFRRTCYYRSDTERHTLIETDLQ